MVVSTILSTTVKCHPIARWTPHSGRTGSASQLLTWRKMILRRAHSTRVLSRKSNKSKTTWDLAAPPTRKQSPKLVSRRMTIATFAMSVSLKRCCRDRETGLITLQSSSTFQKLKLDKYLQTVTRRSQVISTELFFQRLPTILKKHTKIWSERSWKSRLNFKAQTFSPAVATIFQPPIKANTLGVRPCVSLWPPVRQIIKLIQGSIDWQPRME